MLHADIPTRHEIADLASATAPWSVSIYTPTEADVAEPDASRVAFSNQVREALEQVTDSGAQAALSEMFDDLLDDPEFWRYQSRTLVVLATPARIRIYRLPNRLAASTTVADRFTVKPLLRTATFPQAAYVLALSEGASRLVRVDAEGPAVDITPRDLPASASDYAKKATLSDRAPKRRVQGDEGRKMRVRQYARAVDQELRAELNGRDTPLVLAATEPTDSLFRSVNTYPDLLNESLAGNPEHLSPDELAVRVRPILDRFYGAQLADLGELFDQRASEGRALTDTADIARAATFGIVDTLFVDIDTPVPGALGADGAVEFDSAAEGSDVLDEIARRVLLTDGRVLAVRAPEVPGGGTAAAILRYTM